MKAWGPLTITPIYDGEEGKEEEIMEEPPKGEVEMGCAWDATPRHREPRTEEEAGRTVPSSLASQETERSVPHSDLRSSE